jgi:hypothetical protein
MSIESYSCLIMAVLPNRGLSYYFQSLFEPVNACQCLSMSVHAYPCYCADSRHAYLSLHWSLQEEATYVEGYEEGNSTVYYANGKVRYRFN